MSWDDLFEDNYDWPVWRQSEARRGKDGEWRDAQGELREPLVTCGAAVPERVYD